jgi:hypothetical protein
MILSTHGVIASQIQSFVGLLDLYPNAAAAYSVRKLIAAYSGSAIKVRRSSDNTEQNIGFTALGNLDESALTTFCSGTDGFVTTWYDQSGNAKNATQTTAANQPKIVSAGVILTQTGIGSSKPILRFDGVNDSFNFSTITAAQFTTFYPSKKAANADLSAWFTRTVGTVAPFSPIIFGTAGTYIGNATKGSYTTSYNNNNYILMSGYINSSNDGFIQINNSAITLGLTLPSSGDNEFTSINQRGGASYSKCDVPEMIFYAFNNSSNLSAINSNINTYYGIY